MEPGSEVQKEVWAGDGGGKMCLTPCEEGVLWEGEAEESKSSLT